MWQLIHIIITYHTSYHRQTDRQTDISTNYNADVLFIHGVHYQDRYQLHEVFSPKINQTSLFSLLIKNCVPNIKFFVSHLLTLFPMFQPCIFQLNLFSLYWALDLSPLIFWGLHLSHHYSLLFSISGGEEVKCSLWVKQLTDWLSLTPVSRVLWNHWLQATCSKSNPSYKKIEKENSVRIWGFRIMTVIYLLHAHLSFNLQWCFKAFQFII